MFRRFLAFIIGIIVSINLMCIQPMHVQGSADKSTIRVLLSSMGSPKQVTINVNGDYGIKDLDNSLLKKGDYTISIASGALVLNDGAKSTPLGSKFTFTRYKGDNPNQLKIGNYNYLGDMEVRLDGGGIRLVNHVHLETYLYGVVPYEVSNTWPIEVQKAQAVAARTYAVGNKKPGSYYDVHDTVADQVYKGYDPKNTNSIKAVNDTFGQVLKYGSGYAHTFYSASNGGTIEASNNLWSGSIPYLVVKADEYDARSTVKTSNTPWKATFKKSPVDPALLKRLKFTDALKAQGLAEAGIENLQIKAFDFKTNTSSRADNVTITLSMDKKPKVEGAPPEEIKISFKRGDIRTILDVNSLLFTVEDKGESFVLDGKGWGHGIGMSQHGAYQMAIEKKGYAEILQFYYPGTNIQTLSIDTDRGGDTRPAVPTDPKPDPKPDPDDKKQQYGKVNVSTTLNVRQGAGTNYKLLGSLKKGARVEILDRSGAWYKIKSGSIQGYVHGDYIVLEDKGQTPPPSSGQEPKPKPVDPVLPPSDNRRYGIVTASSLNIRSGPGTKNNRIGNIVKGTKITILGTQSGWHKISFNGKDGYVHGDYVKLESPTTSTPTTERTGTVNASSLNVRTGPGTNYSRAGLLARGTNVTIIGESGSWYRIKSGSITGYVSKNYIK